MQVWKTKSNVTRVGPSTERSMMFLSDEGPVRSKRLTWLISPIYISAANTPTFCILLVFSLKSSKFYWIRFLTFFTTKILHVLINLFFRKFKFQKHSQHITYMYALHIHIHTIQILFALYSQNCCQKEPSFTN